MVTEPEPAVCLGREDELTCGTVGFRDPEAPACSHAPVGGASSLGWQWGSGVGSRTACAQLLLRGWVPVLRQALVPGAGGSEGRVQEGGPRPGGSAFHPTVHPKLGEHCGRF